MTKINRLKIAIVCDWLVTFAGAERVLTELLACFPQADLFSVVDFLPSAQRPWLQNKKATTSFIQKLPFAQKHYRSYLPLMPYAIEQLDVSQYDLVISSSHAVAKGVITHPHQIHLSYVHSPIRYAWDMQHEYLKESGLERGLKSMMVRYFLHKMRIWDQRTTNGVDHFFANSKFIAQRIWKVYRREAEVIYPPCDTSHFKPGLKKENYYVAVSRLVPYKKMDLIVESFGHMPDKKLLVIGDGPDFAKIKAKAKSNVELLGYQPSAQLLYYLQTAKAFVFAGCEDFGIVFLESQACGTPVIAFGKGGALEAIRGPDHQQPTGLFFKEQSINAICDAVKQFDAQMTRFSPDFCVQHAALFSPNRFRERLLNSVSNIIASHKVAKNAYWYHLHND